jgi:hypothetical protein
MIRTATAQALGVASLLLTLQLTASVGAQAKPPYADALATELLTTALGHSDASVRKDSGALFLQYQYLSNSVLRQFGLSLQKYWNVPRPDPVPDYLKASVPSMIQRFAVGDPDPEPNLAFNNAARRTALVTLVEKLKAAIYELEKEASTLR